MIEVKIIEEVCDCPERGCDCPECGSSVERVAQITIMGDSFVCCADCAYDYIESFENAADVLREFYDEEGDA